MRHGAGVSTSNPCSSALPDFRLSIIPKSGGLSGRAGGKDPFVAEKLSRLVRVEVLCDRGAPFAVRQALAKLDSLGQVFDDLVLIASELVTNAVLYSGCSSEDVIRVRLDGDEDHVLL